MIFIIVGMHRSAKDEVFTSDVIDSDIEGPATIVEVDIEMETQEYNMSTVSKECESHLDRRKSTKEAFGRTA
jgi:hypothetical protein